ncbi:MAG TPA: hypothetical protein VHD36_10135 [Pirellulales bacterium]|mgnify:CR=1 FL=1|nr:hypothetical protein [Pirellulales bacterium]
MIKKSALGVLLLLSVIGVASPAFAQTTHFGSRGAHGYVVDPPAGQRSDTFPSATGGGSAGYNWSVEHDY